MFSPYYAFARRRGRGEPTAHCALNVVLSSPGMARWTMTERGAESLARGDASLGIGASLLAWNGTALSFAIDEATFPLPGRVRGEVRLEPLGTNDRVFDLDDAGRHRWWPFAPLARIRVELERPRLAWTGTGYFDMNWGARPLEADFREWDWSRARLDAEAAILYDVVRRDGSTRNIAVNVSAEAGVRDMPAPPRAKLAAARWWRLPRETRCDPDSRPRVMETLLDSPFYARSVIASRWHGREVVAMHESLSLERFSQPWVQMLLPFRVPRRAGRQRA